MKKVLLAANISESFKKLLDERGYESIIYESGKMQYDVEGIVTSTKLKLNARLLGKFGKLKWVARLGSGIEIIDTAFCKENNIAFASSPDGISNAVGEHCIAMLVALQKNIATSFSELKNNQWIREPNRGWEIFGKTIGLIGYGHTAQAFAKKLQGFGCNIIAFDKFQKGFEAESVKEVSLNDLQTTADVISFHVPANDETFHYYNEQFIANCRKHILVNTSRGDVVCTDSLLKGLEDNTIIGAALDVLEHEHLLLDSKSDHWQTVHELLNYNTIITPHIAGYSYDAIEKMSTELMIKLAGVI